MTREVDDARGWYDDRCEELNARLAFNEMVPTECRFTDEQLDSVRRSKTEAWSRLKVAEMKGGLIG